MCFPSGVATISALVWSRLQSPSGVWRGQCARAPASSVISPAAPLRPPSRRTSLLPDAELAKDDVEDVVALHSSDQFVERGGCRSNVDGCDARRHHVLSKRRTERTDLLGGGGDGGPMTRPRQSGSVLLRRAMIRDQAIVDRA